MRMSMKKQVWSRQTSDASLAASSPPSPPLVTFLLVTVLMQKQRNIKVLLASTHCTQTRPCTISHHTTSCHVSHKFPNTARDQIFLRRIRENLSKDEFVERVGAGPGAAGVHADPWAAVLRHYLVPQRVHHLRRAVADFPHFARSRVLPRRIRYQRSFLQSHSLRLGLRSLPEESGFFVFATFSYIVHFKLVPFS